MGRVYDGIDGELRAWIEAQHLFFVATAPLAGDGHVNLSPRGLDTLRVLDERSVAWLDLTGSGVETIAHLRENGRITLMFCALEGRPLIVRLAGTGEVLPPDDALAAAFPELPGARAIVRVAVERVWGSCGYGVPLYAYRRRERTTFRSLPDSFFEDLRYGRPRKVVRSLLREGERDTLVRNLDRRGPANVAEYQRTRNAESIDGLPGLPGVG